MLLRLFLFLFLSLLASCGPRSLDDFEEEGEGVIRALIREFEQVHSHEELVAVSAKMQLYFDQLVSLMIAAEEFIDQNPSLKNEAIEPNHELSDLLRSELNRLYRLEGGRQVIEKCQEKALHRLDAFHQRSRGSMKRAN